MDTLLYFSLRPPELPASLRPSELTPRPFQLSNALPANSETLVGSHYQLAQRPPSCLKGPLSRVRGLSSWLRDSRPALMVSQLAPSPSQLSKKPLLSGSKPNPAGSVLISASSEVQSLTN